MCNHPVFMCGIPWLKFGLNFLIPEWWLLQQFLPLTLKHLFCQGISVWYPSFPLNNSATVMIANRCFRKIQSFQMLENDMNHGCPWWLDLHSEITESDHAVSPLIPGHWDVPKPLFNLVLVSLSAAQREILSTSDLLTKVDWIQFFGNSSHPSLWNWS